jgi:hypothetical protein
VYYRLLIHIYSTAYNTSNIKESEKKKKIFTFISNFKKIVFSGPRFPTVNTVCTVCLGPGPEPPKNCVWLGPGPEPPKNCVQLGEGPELPKNCVWLGPGPEPPKNCVWMGPGPKPPKIVSG